MTSVSRSGSACLVVILCCFQTIVAFTSPLRPVTSSSGEPISVQQLDVVNDVASKSTATSHNAAADDSLSLRLTMTSSSSSSSSSVVLNLRRNEFIDDQTPVYVASHGLIVRWTDFPANQSFVVYTDAANQAAMLLQSRVTSSGHVFKNYHGTFRLGGDSYLLASLSSQRRQTDDDAATTTADSNDDYVAYRLLPTPNNYTDDDDDDEVPPDNYDWMQYENITSQFPLYVIEVLMVVDYAIYRSWYELSRERTSAAKYMDAINSIRYYYSCIAAGMDVRFAAMHAADFRINIRFAGIYVATTRADAPWTEDTRTKLFHDGVVFIDAYKSLDLFQAWIADTVPNLSLPPFDQATLFTAHIVTSSISNRNDLRRIAGLGNIAGLCTSRSVTVCQEWNVFASVGTATHELGHNLGAYHDGQSNDCSSKDQYVMAKSPAELSENNFLHPYQFSRCSVTYFRAYLNKLNTKNNNCVLNSTVGAREDDETIVLPPGQIVPADKQCQLVYGSDSFYCAGSINDRSICEKMPCYYGATKKCHSRTEQRAADGTTCGDRMWCDKGKCVHHEWAPNAAAYCVYGDSKAPFPDGTTCVTKLAANPGLCYQDHYNATCCYTCQQIKDRHSADCPYGDRADDYCADLKTRDCYTERVRQTCCATCRRRRLHLTGCEYGDRASWCPSMTDGSQCYDANKGRTCCFTCNYLRSYGTPGCEYGDRATWCKSYTVEQCQKQPTINDTCCFTCRGKTHNVVDTSCQDNEDWCQSIPPSYCYSTDKTCCKTCRAFNIHVPGCEYGNRFSWCNSTMTRDDCQQYWNVDDCCYSCYVLANVTRTTPKPSHCATLSHVAPLNLAAVALLLLMLARLQRLTY